MKGINHKVVALTEILENCQNFLKIKYKPRSRRTLRQRLTLGLRPTLRKRPTLCHEAKIKIKTFPLPGVISDQKLDLEDYVTVNVC